MMTTDMVLEEQIKLDTLQRAWQIRRMPSTSSLFEETAEEVDIFAPPSQSAPVSKGRCLSPPLPTVSCSDGLEPDSLDIVQDQLAYQEVLVKDAEEHLSARVLDASMLGDLPAVYTVYGLEPHQMPAVGVYVDNRIIPGFKYRVRPLPGYHTLSVENPYIFNEKALTLRSIGRGYSRRFTFQADADALNNNENYFWSDSRPEGFAFELELVSQGDRFTVFDANHEAQGTLEIMSIEGAQSEISSSHVKEGIEKKATINFIGKVEFYETGVAKPMPMAGVVVSIKRKGTSAAQVTKVTKVVIKRHRYFLVPGIQKAYRRVTVRGEDIGDVPTKYTMTGLEHYEIPVVGTYIDSRIIPGFYYRVRPNDRKEHLFGGRSLKLCSIGMGYAKRLTFQPDSLVAPDNYLWSDNHPDGLGLEPRAIHVGMEFSIVADGQVLGQASVFRADRPQIEEKMEKEITSSGKVAIVKYIHIDVMCHIKLAIIGKGDSDERLMRVYGLSVVRKEPNSNNSHMVRVENVAFDSQLNLIFARNHCEVTFLPM